MVTTNQPPFVPSMSLMLLRYMHKFVCLSHFFPNHGPFPYMQQPQLRVNNHQFLTAIVIIFLSFLSCDKKKKCMHTVNYVHLLKNCTIFTSPCSLHVNSISYSHFVLNFCTRHCDLLGVCHNKLIEKTQTTMLHTHQWSLYR